MMDAYQISEVAFRGPYTVVAAATGGDAEVFSTRAAAICRAERASAGARREAEKWLADGWLPSAEAETGLRSFCRPLR